MKALVALEEMPSSDPLYSVAILDFVNTVREWVYGDSRNHNAFLRTSAVLT